MQGKKIKKPRPPDCILPDHPLARCFDITSPSREWLVGMGEKGEDAYNALMEYRREMAEWRIQKRIMQKDEYKAYSSKQRNRARRGDRPFMTIAEAMKKGLLEGGEAGEAPRAGRPE